LDGSGVTPSNSFYSSFQLHPNNSISTIQQFRHTLKFTTMAHAEAASVYPPLEARPVKSTICLFDVDGTLTPARRVRDPPSHPRCTSPNCLSSLLPLKYSNSSPPSATNAPSASLEALISSSSKNNSARPPYPSLGSLISALRKMASRLIDWDSRWPVRASLAGWGRRSISNW